MFIKHESALQTSLPRLYKWSVMVLIWWWQASLVNFPKYGCNAQCKNQCSPLTGKKTHVLLQSNSSWSHQPTSIWPAACAHGCSYNLIQLYTWWHVFCMYILKPVFKTTYHIPINLSRLSGFLLGFGLYFGVYFCHRETSSPCKAIYHHCVHCIFLAWFDANLRLSLTMSVSVYRSGCWQTRKCPSQMCLGASTGIHHVCNK